MGSSPVQITAPGKYPDEDLDYSYDWTRHLAEGEAIDSVAITATGGLEIHHQSQASAVTTFWVNGGTVSPVSHPVVSLLATTNSTPQRKVGVNITIPLVTR